MKQKSQLQLYSSQLYSRLENVMSFMLVLRIFAQIKGWEVQAKQQLQHLDPETKWIGSSCFLFRPCSTRTAPHPTDLAELEVRVARTDGRHLLPTQKKTQRCCVSFICTILAKQLGSQRSSSNSGETMLASLKPSKHVKSTCCRCQLRATVRQNLH